jgi:imidazole glycerol-phosphate synthase subunit HisF
MLRVRVIPALLLRDESLVKTTRFKKFTYVGDPCNTVRIFNELEVDELAFLDIDASRSGRSPNLALLAEIADECFMPLSYGGGIRTLDDARRVFDIGFEKVVLNTSALEHPELITEIAERYGSQAVIVSIDVKRDWLGRERVWSLGGRKAAKLSAVEWAKAAEAHGAGELLLTAIDREGSWSGFDTVLTRSVAQSVDIPVIAHGGAGSIEHIRDVVTQGGASAVAVGSMVVFQKKNMGVLVNFPDQSALRAAIG